MTFTASYKYSDRNIFDLKTLLEAIRFIIVNTILFLILLFLALEELDWAIFSYKERISDKVIDKTSWNIKRLI